MYNMVRCQRFSPRQTRFQFSVSGKRIWNHEVALDLTFLIRISVLLVIDSHRHFSTGTFTKQLNWQFGKAFILWWALFCPGYPYHTRHDKGSQFTSYEWIDIVLKIEIKVIFFDIESCNCLEPGKWLNDPFHRILGNPLYISQSSEQQLHMK